MQNRASWANFDGTVLICSPFVCIELYQLVLLETFREESVSQSNLPLPPIVLLEWVLRAISSQGPLEFTCVVESAADFIVSFASCEFLSEGNAISHEACQNIIQLFKSLSESFVCNKCSKSDVTTLKKIGGALYYLSKNHGQRLNIVKELTMVPNLFLLRNAKAIDSFPQLLLNELFDVSKVQIDAGAHSMVHNAARMYSLIKASESSTCSTLFQKFQHAKSFGVTPFACDTSQQAWHNVVMENQWLRRFNSRKQTCIDFIDFVRLYKEHAQDSVINRGAGESSDVQNTMEAPSEQLEETVRAFTLLQKNSRFIRDLSKSLDEEFLQHIELEIQKRDPEESIQLKNSNNESKGILPEEKNNAIDIEAKEDLLKQIAHLKQSKKLKSEAPMRSTFTDAEYVAIKTMKNKKTNVYSDSRQMKGFMLLLLGNLDNVLDGMTSLQTAVTVQWRILRMISYVFVAASKKTKSMQQSCSLSASRASSPIHPRASSPTSSALSSSSSSFSDVQENGRNFHTKESKQLLFPLNDGVAGYAVEFFSYGNGLVSLCRVLSSSYQIRLIAGTAGIAMATTSNACTYQFGYSRSDAIYFTQNNHAPERYATTAVLLLLEWLILRLRSSANIRHDIRKMVHVRDAKVVVPRLENYYKVAQRKKATDTILALQLLAAFPKDAGCGNGSIIADLASRVLDCSLEQLIVPKKKKLDSVLTHLRAIHEDGAVLNRGQWASERREINTKIEREQNSMEAWWVDPQAAQGPSPWMYDQENAKTTEQENAKTTEHQANVFLNTKKSIVGMGERDNEKYCCAVM